MFFKRSGILASILLMSGGLILSAHAKSQGQSCKKSIANAGSKNTEGNLKERTERYAHSLMRYVKKAYRLPSHEQLAEILEITPKELTEYFKYKTSPDSVGDLMYRAHQLFPDESARLQKKATTAMARLFKASLTRPDHDSVLSEMGIEDGREDFELIFGEYRDLWEDSKEVNQRDHQIAARKLVSAYAKFTREKKATPFLPDLAEILKIEVSELEKLIGPDGLFEDMESLRMAARDAYPASFRFALDRSIFDESRLEAILEDVQSRSKIIVTTAVSGADLAEGMLEALMTYAREEDACILILPMNMATDKIHHRLLETAGVHILTEDIELSKLFRINPRLRPMAKMMNPLASTQRIGTRGQSQIFPGTKLFLDVVATQERIMYPHRIMTTGAITKADYNGGLEISHRTDYIAEEDHFYGALVLEKNNGRADFLGLPGYGNFHARHVEFIPEKKAIVDLNKEYNADGEVKTIRPKVLALEPHVGETYESMAQAARSLIEEFQPEEIVLHDVLNGHSISPHDSKKLITMAQKADEGILDLELELRQVAAFINSIHRIDPSIVVKIVDSNHDYWLNRWIQGGEYHNSPQNLRLGAELAAVMAHGKHPLEYALLSPPIQFPTQLDDPRPALVNHPDKVVFVKSGEGYRVGPPNREVELGLHGHQGANGASGSLKTYLESNGRILFGHTHTYARKNGAVNFGTFTSLVQNYNRGGLSSWVNTVALVGPNGEIQVLEWVDSEFYTPRDEDTYDATQFFPEEYPRFLLREDGHDYEQGGPEVGQLDQYTEHSSEGRRARK